MYSISGMTLRPTMSTFLDAPRTCKAESRDIFEKYQREYEALADEFHRAMSLAYYFRIKCGLGPRVVNMPTNFPCGQMQMHAAMSGMHMHALFCEQIM
jgi:hypothetical protein